MRKFDIGAVVETKNKAIMSDAGMILFSYENVPPTVWYCVATTYYHPTAHVVTPAFPTIREEELTSSDKVVNPLVVAMVEQRLKEEVRNKIGNILSPLDYAVGLSNLKRYHARIR